MQQKAELSAQADRKTNIMTWVGLGLMSVQFGILARLTWWEYSWDIMEPVTYFVTYGTAMAMYAYYCITKTVSSCFFFKVLTTLSIRFFILFRNIIFPKLRTANTS